MICSRHAAWGEVSLTKAVARALYSVRMTLWISGIAVSLNVFTSEIEVGKKAKNISNLRKIDPQA